MARFLGLAHHSNPQSYLYPSLLADPPRDHQHPGTAVHAPLHELDGHNECYDAVRTLRSQFILANKLKNDCSMFILVGIASAAGWVVRYRILNMYSRLPPEPQRLEPELDLFPDTHEESTKSGFSSYLDEFLSAIKIFGYLERPVFHELTRSMQTRKLIAGETISLEDEKGFCIVVDGLVEIFVKSVRQDRSSPTQHFHDEETFSDSEDDVVPGQQRYQLLTEIRNGAPMSSLFSIMSLFTEDINLRSGDSSTPPEKSSRHMHDNFGDHLSIRGSSEVPASMPSTPQLGEKCSVRNGMPHLAETGQHLAIPSMFLDGPALSHSAQRPALGNALLPNSAHPDILARATIDTTIAVIPASAFRRLIKIYPKATSHIVHVILSRFQRVTLSQALNYLGLVNDVLQTERRMVKYTMCQLPNMLRGDALDRLKEKFTKERERMDEDESKGIALHNPAATRRRRSSIYLRKEAMLQSMSKYRQASCMADPSSGRRGIGVPQTPIPQTPGPGDFLIDTQLARGIPKSPPRALAPGADQDRRSSREASPIGQQPRDPFDPQRNARMTIHPREAAKEDDLFRESILECMFKSLGLDSGGTASREPSSVEASPQLVSLDARRSRALFANNNAFGFMGPLEASVDGETESLTSGGLANHTPPSPHALSQEMKDEVEIVFFPKSSVLVEQGERSPGLYYVIDGFLDIGSAIEEQSTNLFQASAAEPEESQSRGLPSPSKAAFAKFARVGTGGSRSSSRKRTSNRRSVALIKPGGLAGYIGSVCSYRSFIDVVAKTDVYVGFLPRASLERIVDRYPIVLLTMAKRLTSILPRLILHIDFALEWVQVNAGQVIFRDGDESDAIYIVLNGRLRLVEDREDGGMTALAEFGQGDSVGELEVLTESARSGTLHAIRDTEMVKFPRTLFNSLAQEHPNITIKISKIIASRMRAVVEDPSKLTGNEAGSGAINNQRKSTMNLRTVAILPVTAGVPVVEFGNRLMAALAQVGPPNGATCLNQSAILKHLGKHAFNKMGKLRLSQYLADLEEKFGLVVYVAGKMAFCLFFWSLLSITVSMMNNLLTPEATPLTAFF